MSPLHWFSFATPEYDEAVRLRYEILRKPLGLAFNTEALAREYEDFHLGYYDGHGRLVGCLILTPLTEQSIKMRQVAVAEAMQGKGVGAQMVQEAEHFAREKGYREMVLNARESAAAFYDKLDYQRMGERFEEVGIPHFKMMKRL